MSEITSFTAKEVSELSYQTGWVMIDDHLAAMEALREAKDREIEGLKAERDHERSERANLLNWIRKLEGGECMKKITREEFASADSGLSWGDLWNHISSLQSELEALEGRKGVTEIDKGGHALHEASWAFIESWKQMGLGPMSGDTWNNCKQGIVYPVVKAYLDNLIPLPPKVTRERTREKLENELTAGNVISLYVSRKLDMTALKAVCTAAGISTTTEEV